jgi:hypothetical protein
MSISDLRLAGFDRGLSLATWAWQLRFLPAPAQCASAAILTLVFSWRLRPPVHQPRLLDLGAEVIVLDAPADHRPSLSGNR